MTEAEISERFIRAAEVERKLPRAGERPKGYGGYVLQFVHSERDLAAWRHDAGDPKDQYDKEDRSRYAAQYSREFWEGRTTRPTSAELSEWEQCLRWTAELVTDTRQRRALWAWAFSKVGGRSFAKWCRQEGIHRNTGMTRKNLACMAISTQVVRSGVQNSETGPICTLQERPEMGHVLDTVEAHDPIKGIRFDPYQIADSSGVAEFDWSDRRNASRRQRAAERKRVAA